MGAPFAGMLLSIAIFPLAAPRFWEHHQGKIAAMWAALIVLPLAVWYGPLPTVQTLVHTALLEYIPFILLLLALFTVAGGIVVRGNLHGSPVLNTLLLALGTLIASVIGTTGASMVMIRPVLRANDDRRHNAHVVIFFIFLVSNIGGSLSPLGDPPLFLGFLRGVDFFWTTTHLFPRPRSWPGFCSPCSFASILIFIARKAASNRTQLRTIPCGSAAASTSL